MSKRWEIKVIWLVYYENRTNRVYFILFLRFFLKLFRNWYLKSIGINNTTVSWCLKLCFLKIALNKLTSKILLYYLNDFKTKEFLVIILLYMKQNV